MREFLAEFIASLVAALIAFWSVVIFSLLLIFTTIIPVVYLVEYFWK